jgi:hypothetical protein
MMSSGSTLKRSAILLIDSPRLSVYSTPSVGRMTRFWPTCSRSGLRMPLAAINVSGLMLYRAASMRTVSPSSTAWVIGLGGSGGAMVA